MIPGLLAMHFVPSLTVFDSNTGYYMSDIYSCVINVFKQFLDSDQKLLTEINHYQGTVYIDNEALLFTLPALKDFIDTDKHVSYLVFRKILYGNFTNKKVNALGGRVVIHKADKSVDLTLYKLIQST